MRKISKQEVADLYRFTREHYVEYYDVQTELVDHLANGIETRWQEDPDISFEQALHMEFKRFGVFGFSEVVEQRERAMYKKYHKLIFNEFKSVLQRTKVALLLFLTFWLSRFLLGLDQAKDIFTITLLISFCLILLFVGIRARRRRSRKGKKVFLLETIIYNTGSSFSLVWVPFHLLNLMDAEDGSLVHSLMAFFITLLALTSYVCFFSLPDKKDEILKKVYPEMKFT